MIGVTEFIGFDFVPGWVGAPDAEYVLFLFEEMHGASAKDMVVDLATDIGGEAKEWTVFHDD